MRCPSFSLTLVCAHTRCHGRGPSGSSYNVLLGPCVFATMHGPVASGMGGQ
jgi:hypothetical protein